MSKIFDIEMCRAALIDRGWEQKDIAAKTGLSESAVSKFFRGETVRNSTAAMIIRALGLQVKNVRLNNGASPVPLRRVAAGAKASSQRSMRG
jgi:transcriptional regulator with XRE-family HTH domain